jgi:hypothetical protein
MGRKGNDEEKIRNYSPNLAFFFAQSRSPGWLDSQDLPGKGKLKRISLLFYDMM